MKKEMKIAFLIMSCLMVVSFLLLQPSSVGALDLSGGIKYTIDDPWPPPPQCPDYWHGGWHLDLNDLGSPLPQGVCLEGEWYDEGVIVEKDVPMPMRDGLQLRVNVYRPKKPGKFPVIMTFSSYTKALAGWGKMEGVYNWLMSNETSFEFTDPAFWVPSGYVVVLVDPRGYGNSPGVRMTSDSDYYDGIEWAGTQEWSNGNVGMIGISALANCQWRTAAVNPPHLKAIAPWEGSGAEPNSRFGGIPEYGFAQTVAIRGGSLPPDPAKGQYPAPAGTPPLPPPVIANINVPLLACVTSSDQELHTRGTLWGYRHVSSKYKWMYSHGGQKWARFYSADAKAFQKMFFDQFLKGTDSRILETPRVRLEVRETLDKFEVRYEDEMPIHRTKYAQLYLDATNGSLNFHKVRKPGKITYDSTTPNGKAQFDIKFDEDTELTGYMKLAVFASPEDFNDMDLFVTVKKFDASGNEVFFDCYASPKRFPVALGWLRLSKRQLDLELSTSWNPIHDLTTNNPVNPGEIVPAEVEMIFSSTLFRAGETLRLIISGKPQHQSNRYAYHDLNVGRHSIYTGSGYDSYLQVPVIPPRHIVIHPQEGYEE